MAVNLNKLNGKSRIQIEEIAGGDGDIINAANNFNLRLTDLEATGELTLEKMLHLPLYSSTPYKTLEITDQYRRPLRYNFLNAINFFSTGSFGNYTYNLSTDVYTVLPPSDGVFGQITATVNGSTVITIPDDGRILGTEMAILEDYSARRAVLLVGRFDFS